MSHDPYQEMLGDPYLPFDLHWPIMSEIDDANQLFGIFSGLFKTGMHGCEYALSNRESSHS